MNHSVRMLGLAAFGLAGVALAVGVAGSASTWSTRPTPSRAGRLGAPKASVRPLAESAPLPGSPVAQLVATEPRPLVGVQRASEPIAEPANELRPYRPLVTAAKQSRPAQGTEAFAVQPLPDFAGAQRQPPAAEHAEDEVASPKPDVAPTKPTAPLAIEQRRQPAPAAPSAPSKADEQLRIVGSVGEGDGHLSINLQDTDIHKVLQLLSKQGGLNILSTKSVTGTVTASLNDVDLDTALAAILQSTGFVSRREGKFIYVGSPQDFQTMAEARDKVNTRIYRPNYVRAAELQALFTPLLTKGTGTIGVTSPADSGIAADSAVVGGDKFAGSDAVVVRDFEAVLAQIDQIFTEVDRRPPQVAIEAMILSVKLNDDNNFGVDFQFLRDKKNVRFATGSPLADLGNLSFTDGGLKFGFLDSSLGAFVNALESIGDVNVIATPRVLCINKQRAEILIGAQKGYINSTTTETSTTQSVEFLEVGTQLRIRPFISSDGLIRMEVHPELSTGTVSLLGGFTLPEKEVTQVTTNVMVRDGCTVIIGGLMREDLTQTTTRVPFFGSAPGIGFLFRSKKEATERHELIVLITPRIVYDCDMCPEGARAAGEFHRRQAMYADQMSPIGARYLGRMYFRKAQDAWSRGDRDAAYHAIRLALHFDPLNRSAIDLRSDILAENHFGDYSNPPGSPVAEPLPPVDEPAQPGPFVQPNAQPLHPLDPGQTGRTRSVKHPEAKSEAK